MMIVHVTHRVDVARNFDFVLEFTKDNVVNKGTFDELLSSSPTFAELLFQTKHSSPEVSKSNA